MEQPGVEVRPLVQITGDAEFNEVFFNDARVRHDWMLGREGDGWKVAITTLMNERVSLSGAGSIGGDAVGGSPVDRLLERHRGHHGSAGPPAARERLHREPAHPPEQPAGRRQAQERRRGRAGGLDHEAACRPSSTSACRSWRSTSRARAAWRGRGATCRRTSAAGRSLQVEQDASIAFGFLRAQANTIEGGTSDIMRNILGERVLGLPKEPDNSRELPWSEVPRSC